MPDYQEINKIFSVLWEMLHAFFFTPFNYLGSVLTNAGRCTCEIKSRFSMAKAAFNKKRALFTSTLDFELRKKLVNCCI